MKPGDLVLVYFSFSHPLLAEVVEPGDTWTTVRETIGEHELDHRLLTRHMEVVT